MVGCARILPAHLRGLATLRGAGLETFDVTALCARALDDAVMFRRRGEGPAPRPPASANEQDPLGAPHVYVSDIQDEPPAVFDDWRAMLDADLVDAVLVLAPVALHHEVALDALRAGKHVLIEKPLAITVRTAQAVVAESSRRGLVVGVAETQRYAARTRALRWVLEQGLVGDPQVWLSGGVGGEWAPDLVVAHTPWRHRKLDAGGGPAIDHGVHQMHQIRHLMGEIDEVDAMARTLEPVRYDLGAGGTRTPVQNEVDDIYLAQFRFASGAVGSSFSGWAGRGTGTALDASPVIYGTRGVLKGDQVFADDGLLGGATQFLTEGAAPGLVDGFFPGGIRDAFALELLDFARAIAAGTQTQASAAEGLADLASAYAILESSHAGGPVRIADVMDGSIRAYQEPIDDHVGF